MVKYRYVWLDENIVNKVRAYLGRERLSKADWDRILMKWISDVVSNYEYNEPKFNQYRVSIDDEMYRELEIATEIRFGRVKGYVSAALNEALRSFLDEVMKND